ncbi:Uncharacterised protein [uncultured Roseburia sp.]|nr:Uncharacterised protein [uncultured Roseburia sp.]
MYAVQDQQIPCKSNIDSSAGKRNGRREKYQIVE